MADDDDQAPDQAPVFDTVVVRLDLNPAAAKIIDHLFSERLRIIAAEIAQHPPVHTKRVLDEHVAELTTVRAELARAIANPIAVPVPSPGGGE